MGRDLITVLENQLVTYYVHGNKEAYPHKAGLKFKLDLLQPQGQRIQNIKLLGNTCHWKPFKENESYFVITNSIIADFFFARKALEVKPTGRGETEMFWSHTSSVCFLNDNWHQLRLEHQPTKIPLDPLREVEAESSTKATGESDRRKVQTDPRTLMSSQQFS